MARDVFISYAIEDRATADKICQKLEAEGYSCWIAPRDIRPGQRFAEAIVDAISGTQVTVLVFSGNANNSLYVHNEVAAAFEKGLPIIPFRIEDVLPSVGLKLYVSSVQRLDAVTQPVEQHFDKLIGAIASYIPRKSQKPILHEVEGPTTVSLRALGKSLKKHVGGSGTLQHRWKKHRKKVAVLAAATVFIMSLAYVAHRYFLAPTLWPVGVSISETGTGIPAIQALRLYRDRFAEKHSKHPNQGIHLVHGNFERHLDNRVLGVIGKLTSDGADNECEDYERIRMVYISPGASNPHVTAGKKWVFSMNYDDMRQGRMIAKFLFYVRKCRSVAVVYEETPYSSGLKDGFLPQLFPSCHMIPLNIRRNFPVDFVVERLKPLWQDEKPIDAVVLLTFSQESASLTKTLRNHGFKDLIMAPESCFKDSFIRNIGREQSNLYVATPFVYEFGTKAALEFRNDFRKAYGNEPSLWSLFSYEALDLLVRTSLNLKSQENQRVSEQIGKAFDRMRSIGTAMPGLSGPLFLEKSGSIHRPVVITYIDDDRFRPVSIQVQERCATERSNQEIITKRVERGEAMANGKNLESRDTYLVKIPVIYTKVDVNRLSKFDAYKKSVEVDYKVCTEWPQGSHDQSSELTAKAVDFIFPQMVTGSSKEEQDFAPSNPARGSEAIRCCMRQATLRWDSDLKRFPLDFHIMRLLVGFSGKGINEAVLAADVAKSENITVPSTDSQFDVVKCSDCSDRTYLDVQETSSHRDPWTGESLQRRYDSVYELQFLLKRKPLFGTIVLLPLVLAVLSWVVFVIADDHSRIGLAISGIAVVGLFALYSLLVVPYNPPFLSLVNGSFVVGGLMVVAAFLFVLLTTRQSGFQMSSAAKNLEIHTSSSDSDRSEVGEISETEPLREVKDEELNDPPGFRFWVAKRWLPRSVLVLAIGYTAVIAVFWIQWMRASTLCQ